MLRQEIAGFIASVLLLAACADVPVAPSSRAGQSEVLLSPGTLPCDQQIIPDESCNSEGGPSLPYEAYYEELPSETWTPEASLQVQEASTDASISCPRSLTGSTTAIVTDPNTAIQWEIHSRGTWTINWPASLLYLPSNQAVYNWPQSASGWTAWPVDDYDESGVGEGMAIAHIARARAVCFGGGNIMHVVFYGVVIHDPWNRTKRRRGGASGGGGNDGATQTCVQEEYILEINYGDGTGWHELWRGYVTRCS